MRVIIAGGRDFNDYVLLSRVLQEELVLGEDEIVSGTAKGADSMGERYAEEWKYPIKQFPADWNKYGKSAGYKRNEEMAQYGHKLIAFWDGKSKGTGHMIDLAKKYHLKIKVITY